MRAISLTRNETRKKAVLIKTKAIGEDAAPVIEVTSGNFGYNEKFIKFWDLMDTIKIHGYSRAAISVIGRSAVGTWWTLRKHPEYSKQAKTLHRKKLYDFYMMRERQWDNIKDWYSFAYKIFIAVQYLKFFGQCAFHIVRDGYGNALGLDFLHGFVVPNVDEQGNFKSPAFTQYISKDPTEVVNYNDPRDIVYIINPDWEGYVTGGTDVEALTDFTLPLDIYLQTTAREYVRNRSKPEAFYVLSDQLSDEAFDDFVAAIEEKYMGAANAGKSPVVVQGELDIKELNTMPSSLPYADSRKDARDETFAVAGVSGAKVGLAEDMPGSGGLREYRREFHETTMIPIFRTLEIAFYEQINLREFDVAGWEFKFNNPDFLTLVERATVDMRYWTIGALNPNEIRYGLGYEPRKDEGGDLYSDQLDDAASPSNTPLSNPDTGSPVEGREDEPDDPANTGEPTTDDQDPPRGDNHDDEVRAMAKELKTFKEFSLKRIRKNGTIPRPFKSSIIPRNLLNSLNLYIMRAQTAEDVEGIFDELFGVLREI